jgi:hypothetical protein
MVEELDRLLEEQRRLNTMYACADSTVDVAFIVFLPASEHDILNKASGIVLFRGDASQVSRDTADAGASGDQRRASTLSARTANGLFFILCVFFN